MNIDKARLQIVLLNNMGADVEDKLESAQREQHEFVGGIGALRKAQSGIEALNEHLKRDVREGKIEGMPEPVDIEKEIHKWLQRAVNIVDNLTIQGETMKIQSTGRIGAFTDVMKGHGKKITDLEQKIKTFEKSLKSGDIVEGEKDGTVIPMHRGDPKRRPDGTHPGNPIADRKKAEAKKPTPDPDNVVGTEPGAPKSKDGKPFNKIFAPGKEKPKKVRKKPTDPDNK